MASWSEVEHTVCLSGDYPGRAPALQIKHWTSNLPATIKQPMSLTDDSIPPSIQRSVLGVFSLRSLKTAD